MEFEANILQKEKKIKGSSVSKAQSKYTPLWFLLPALLVIGTVIIYPLYYEAIISFTNANYTNIVKQTQHWVGFDNYIRAFYDMETGKVNVLFFRAFFNTMIWTFLNVFFHVSCGMFMGIVLNRKLPGKPFFRILLILPWAVPQYIVALTWRGMFNNPYGAISILQNKMFGVDGIITTLPLLGHSHWWVSHVTAFATTQWWMDPNMNFVAAIITNIWLGIPFMMMTTLGGLQSINQDLYEAADVDGVSAWQKIRHITLPLLKPVMLPATVLGIIWTFNMINIIYIMNGGSKHEASQILVSLVYNQAFDAKNFGSSAALSVIIFLILLSLSQVITRSQRQQD